MGDTHVLVVFTDPPSSVMKSDVWMCRGAALQCFPSPLFFSVTTRNQNKNTNAENLKRECWKPESRKHRHACVLAP